MPLLSRIFKTTREADTFHTHINPDGTKGGRVADSATVAPTAYIERWAKVLPGAVVGDGERVKDGEFVFRNGQHIRFG